jgi:DNA-binding winged helix-turn-helix (wHTH) protein
VTYRFGRFSLDRGTRELRTEGTELRISPKAFELLLLLVQHRARAVSKAELQQRLWPSTFVGDTNLATLIAEIRRALGDTAHDSAYVRTVHRFGYRFVSEVAEDDAVDGESPRDVRMYLATSDQRFALADGVVEIGRSSEAAIRIDAAGVSRRHARLVIAGDRARIEDLGSKNGTFVGGKPVAPGCVLKDGDEIRVGPVILTFRLVTPTRPTETMTAG